MELFEHIAAAATVVYLAEILYDVLTDGKLFRGGRKCQKISGKANQRRKSLQSPYGVFYPQCCILSRMSLKILEPNPADYQKQHWHMREGYVDSS